MTIQEYILQHRIVAILRGLQPGFVLPVIEALHAGGIRLVEITLNSPNAIALIEQARTKLHDEILIGAGTVINVEDASKAKDAGAQFLISPNTDPSVIAFTKKHGLVSIPGAYTATEVMAAHHHGADIIKIFPVPSPRYISDLMAPLEFLKLMPTGGISQDNILQYQQAGAVAFGIGSSLVSRKQQVDEVSLQALIKKAESLVNSLNHFSKGQE